MKEKPLMKKNGSALRLLTVCVWTGAACLGSAFAQESEAAPTAATLAGGSSQEAVETYCALVQAQGRAQSALLKSPDVFANVGDPNTGTKSVTLGIRQSLARRRQAGTVDLLAEAQCDAYRLEQQLMRLAQRIEQRADLEALQVVSVPLLMSLKAAEKNVELEESLLDQQSATLADVLAASELANALRAELGEAMRRRAQLVHELPKVDDEEADQDVRTLALRASAARARVAELTSKLHAQAGWDVTLSAGARTNTDSEMRRNAGHQKNSNDAFIALNATINLGQAASSRAASSVHALAKQHLNAQFEGGLQTLQRTSETVRALLAADRLAYEDLLRRKGLLQRTSVRVAGVNTPPSVRMQRQLEVQLQALDARLLAAKARMDWLQQWQERNTGAE